MIRFWLFALTSTASAHTSASDSEACVTSLTLLTDAAPAIPTPVSDCWSCVVPPAFGFVLSGVVLTTAPATVNA